MKRYLRLTGALVVLVACFASLDTTVSAASPNISRSYYSTSSIPTGSLVSLVAGKTNEVTLAISSNSLRLIGVSVKTSQSLLAVNSSSSTVQVATDGVVNALVSTVNGNISVGQQVAVSPLDGLGMKAQPGDRVVGTAVTSFNDNTAGSVQEQIADIHGKEHTLTVGYVKLDIAIGTANSSNFSVQSLQDFVQSLTGRPISVLRLIISLIVIVIATISIITLIYASIYGSIVSIGRNPLAKYSVFRTLTSVIVMISFIAVIACVSVYTLVH